MARYYTLAKAQEITPYSSGYPWPYSVSVCFEGMPLPIVVAEGVSHGTSSISLSAADALKAQWHAHFAHANGAWLLPMISRMASGETVTADEALTAYRALHGREPDSYDFPI